MKRKQKNTENRINPNRRSFLKGAIAASATVAFGGISLSAKAFALPPSEVEKALYGPLGLAIGPEGHLFVADSGNYCVRVFESGGRLVRSIGTAGSDTGQLNYPSDVVYENGELFIVDANNGRVCVFDPISGKFKYRFGSLGGTPDRMFTPQGITVAQDIALVANTRGHCCQIWNLETQQAVGVIGMLGDEPTQRAPGDRDLRFRLPTAVEIDSAKALIYIADSKHGRVVVTDLQGGFIGEIDAADSGQKLLRPQDICLSGGELFIADTGNKRIVRVDLKTNKTRILEGNWSEPVGIDVKDGVLALSDWHAIPARRRVMTVHLPG